MMIFLYQYLLDCEECKSFFINKCEVHGPALFITDTPVLMGAADRARRTLPPGLEIWESSIPNAGLGVFSSRETVPAGVHFGPYEGMVVDREEAMSSGYSWVVRILIVFTFGMNWNAGPMSCLTASRAWFLSTDVAVCVLF